jgi:hypothetical protein
MLCLESYLVGIHERNCPWIYANNCDWTKCPLILIVSLIIGETLKQLLEKTQLKDLNHLTENKLYNIDTIPCLLNTDPYNYHIFNFCTAPWASKFFTFYKYTSSLIFNETSWLIMIHLYYLVVSEIKLCLNTWM